MDKQWPGIIDPNLLWVVLKQLLFLFENHLKGRVATFLWITLTSSSSTTSSEVLILNVINETNSLLIVHNSDGVILKLLSPSRLLSCFLARPPPVVDFLFTGVVSSIDVSHFWVAKNVSNKSQITQKWHFFLEREIQLQRAHSKTSATRFGNFWKILATDFLTNVAQYT